MIMFGSDLASKEESVFNDIASIAEVRGRGGFAYLLDQLTEKDWEDIEVLLLYSMSPDGVEVHTNRVSAFSTESFEGHCQEMQ